MTPTMISTIEAHYAARMVADLSTIPFAFSGQATPDVPLYTRFWVIPGDDSVAVGFGRTAKSRNAGIIQIDIMGPKDQGAGQTGDLAWKMAKWFMREQLACGTEGAVSFRDATVKDWNTVGEQHRQTVSVPYFYDFKIDNM